MGTRNAIVVRSGGKIKVSQYGQWDGYPTGQGADICEFIQKKMDAEKFKAALAECEFASDKYIQEKWEEMGADGSGFVDMEISHKFAEKYPEFHRDTAAKILLLIQDKGVRKLGQLDLTEEDSWIEYSYLLDMDKGTLSVYEGLLNPKNEKDGLMKTFTFKKATPKAMKKLEEDREED